MPAPGSGTRTPEEKRARQAVRRRELAAERLAQGLCRTCGRFNEDPETYRNCPQCRARIRPCARRVALRHAAAGRCPCGQEREGEHSRCQRCRASRKASTVRKRQADRAAGNCLRCGQPQEPPILHVTCDACLRKVKESKRKWTAYRIARAQGRREPCRRPQGMKGEPNTAATVEDRRVDTMPPTPQHGKEDGKGGNNHGSRKGLP